MENANQECLLKLSQSFWLVTIRHLFQLLYIRLFESSYISVIILHKQPVKKKNILAFVLWQNNISAQSAFNISDQQAYFVLLQSLLFWKNNNELQGESTALSPHRIIIRTRKRWKHRTFAQQQSECRWSLWFIDELPNTIVGHGTEIDSHIFVLWSKFCRKTHLCLIVISSMLKAVHQTDFTDRIPSESTVRCIVKHWCYQNSNWNQSIQSIKLFNCRSKLDIKRSLSVYWLSQLIITSGNRSESWHIT